MRWKWDSMMDLLDQTKSLPQVVKQPEAELWKWGEPKEKILCAPTQVLV
jgi:hypothetical protein